MTKPATPKSAGRILHESGMVAAYPNGGVMETDREVLLWFHERLVHVHGESELFDYMHRLRAIIAKTPARRYTQTRCLNSMDDLKRALRIKP